MSKKLFSSFLFVVFSSVLAYAGGVTNIKEVVNRSSKSVRLATYEVKSGYEQLRWKKTIPLPGGAFQVGTAICGFRGLITEISSLSIFCKY